MLVVRIFFSIPHQDKTMGNIVEQDEKTNRNTCALHGLIPINNTEEKNKIISWLDDHGIKWKKPGEEVQLWKGGAEDCKWESLKKLKLKEKFIQVSLPEGYEFKTDHCNHRTYFLCDKYGDKKLGCWIKFCEYDFEGRFNMM